MKMSASGLIMNTKKPRRNSISLILS